MQTQDNLQGRSLFHIGCRLRREGLGESQIAAAMTFEVIRQERPLTTEGISEITRSAIRQAGAVEG
jgi:hypothetical protein